MGEEELLARIKELEDQVRILKDIEDIKIVQKSYGYYIEHWMAQEIIDLFSDGPDVSLTLAAGTYLGKEGVRRYFDRFENYDPEFLHQVMQVSGIVTVDPDGRTATGRWYGYGAIAVPREDGVRETFMGGLYGCEYVKEDGIWKIQKLRFDLTYSATPARGWVKPDRLAVADPMGNLMPVDADVPRTFSPRYPSGYIFPFQYKHPVTGKETSEGLTNSAIEEKESGS
ncbi:nuclear transport factor 2 family protein [Thermodesulfobacteriota bacterium]